MSANHPADAARICHQLPLLLVLSLPAAALAVPKDSPSFAADSRQQH
jgi:hypothetical protein